MNKISELYVVAAPGLEAVCAAEAHALGLPGARQDEGGVTFQGGLRELYLANLHLRSATRVLVRLGEVRATDFAELFRKAVRLPWGSFIRPGTAVKVRAVSHRSRLVHSGRIAETLSAAIDRALGGCGVGTGHGGGVEQSILARFTDDRCVISVDSSGELLHRRGWRTDAGEAPLRENLAAAVLLQLGWDGALPLCDPMCGAGTLPIEAAQLASRLAPGRNRTFAFMNWPGFRPGLWQALLTEAERNVVVPSVAILGSDADSLVLATARCNAERAGVAGTITFEAGALGQLLPRQGPGLVVCNPPYGIRLEADKNPAHIYRELGECLRRAFPGWRAAFLAVDEHHARATGLAVQRLAEFRNGGIAVALYATRS